MEKDKELDRDNSVKYLNRAFRSASYKAKIGHKAVRYKNNDGEWETTTLYDYQVEFCYLIDDIQRAPSYIAKKAISKANELILALEAEAE